MGIILFLKMAIKSVNFALTLFVLIHSWKTVWTAPKPEFNIDFNGSVGSYQTNDCSYPGACTDETLANHNNQYPNNQNPNNQTPNNQYPNNETPNNQYSNNETPNNTYPNNQYPNYGGVTTSSNNDGSHDEFDISMNGAVGSTNHNNCNYAGACTDQTLANGGLDNSGQGSNPNNQMPSSQTINNQYPNNETLNDSNPNNLYPNNQYPNNQHPNNAAVKSSGNDDESHNGFDVSMNGIVGSTHHNDCNHAGACTDQTLANGGLGNTGQGTTVIGFTGDQEIVTKQIN